MRLFRRLRKSPVITADTLIVGQAVSTEDTTLPEYPEQPSALPAPGIPFEQKFGGVVGTPDVWAHEQVFEGLLVTGAQLALIRADDEAVLALL